MLKDKSDEYKKGYKAGYQMGAKFSRKYPCNLTDFNRITNDSHYYPSDEFICSNCGLHLEDWYARDEDGELFEFTFRFCPYCGGVIAEERKEK